MLHLSVRDPFPSGFVRVALTCGAALVPVLSFGENELFHQMQLWSQAKIEGTYAAHCMLGLDEELMSDCCFEVRIV